jgi:polysaccharide deacetylase family protein (PEP-CTERM system associated)
MRLVEPSTDSRDLPPGRQTSERCELISPAPGPLSFRHIISVDVEDYFQVEAFAKSVPRSSWNRWPSRVEANTHRVLELFEQYETKATFFFVGWVAKQFPALVRTVLSCGHELACHSFWHQPVYTLSPTEFRQDTRAARDVIEQIAGVSVLGYRAPTWSITGKCMWALDILAEEAFLYDSSIYPIKHDLYGMPRGQRFAYAHPCGNGLRLWEFPPATVRFAGLNFPGAGGGYLRIFPFFYTEWMLRHFERKYKQPLVVYFHPWELDPEQPRITNRLRSRLRHYTNIGRMQERLNRLLQRHSFQTFHEALVSRHFSLLSPLASPTVAGAASTLNVPGPQQIALAERE